MLLGTCSSLARGSSARSFSSPWRERCIVQSTCSVTREPITQTRPVKISTYNMGKRQRDTVGRTGGADEFVDLMRGPSTPAQPKRSRSFMSMEQLFPGGDGADTAHAEDERHLQQSSNDGGWPAKYPLLPKLTLNLGSPSQSPPLTLAVSLSSSYVTLPCGADGDGNGEQQVRYDPSKSSTSFVPGCSFCPSDGAGNTEPNEAQCNTARDRCEVSTYLLMNRNYWAGYLGTDEGSIPAASASSTFISSYSLKDPPLTMACQTTSTGYAAQVGAHVDGVAGLAPADTSLLGQLWTNNLLRDREFTLCVNPMLDRSSGEIAEYQRGMDAGKLTLGGYTPPGGSSVQAVPMDLKKAALHRSTSQPGYYLKVKNIYLTTPSGSASPNNQDNTVKVTFDPVRFSDANSIDGGVMIDPASPYTLLSNQIEAEFTQVWRTLTGQSFGYGEVELTRWELLSLPTLLMELEGVGAGASSGPDDNEADSNVSIVYAIPSTAYMEYVPSTGRHRMRLSLKSTEGSVLGANALQGNNLHFNLQDDEFGFESASSCNDFGPGEAASERKNVMIVPPSPRGGTASSMGAGMVLGSLEMIEAVDTFDFSIAYIAGGGFLAFLGMFLVLYHNLGARWEDSKN